MWANEDQEEIHMARAKKTSSTESAAPKAKKLNIYKATITTAPNDADGSPSEDRVEFVRAKTKASAMSLVAAEIIKVDLAQTEDLLKLAKIVVREHTPAQV
jgi:hypothetical protein